MSIFKLDPSVPFTSKWSGLSEINLTKTQKLKIIVATRSRLIGKNDKRIIWGVLISSVIIVFAFMSAMAFGFLRPSLLWLYFALAPALILGFISYLKFTSRVIGSIKEDIKQINKTKRLTFCLNCNYNLYGSISKTCPECGDKVSVI